MAIESARLTAQVWLIPRGQDPAFVEVHVYDVEQPGRSPRLLPVVGYGYAVAAPDLSRMAVMDYEEQALTKACSLLDPTVPPLVMSGDSVEAKDYYYLEDVPWIMYFYRRYSLHAAYWHDGFGHPRSRGCVNLSPRDARWLFDWASPSLPEGRRAVLSKEDSSGTWVYIYNTTADLALAHALPVAVP